MDIINLDLEKTDQAVNCCQATASVFRPKAPTAET